MKIELEAGEAHALGLNVDSRETGCLIEVEMGPVELAARISLSGRGAMTVEEAREYLTNHRLVIASVRGALHRMDRISFCLDTGGFLEFGSDASVEIKELELKQWFEVFFKSFWSRQSEGFRQKFLAKSNKEVITWAKNSLLSTFLAYANSDSGFELKLPCNGTLMSELYTDFLVARESGVNQFETRKEVSHPVLIGN